MKNIKKSIYLPFWAPFGADFARALGKVPPLPPLSPGLYTQLVNIQLKFENHIKADAQHNNVKSHESR